MSMDSGHEDSFSTPRRAQKCLFGPAGSTSKKNTQEKNNTKGDDSSSGEESDLGPMSPLELTDGSPSTNSSDSSREYVSPFASPEITCPVSSRLSWDRLINSPKRKTGADQISPFSSLRKLTRSARYSPRKKLHIASPKSIPNSPERETRSPRTPKDAEMCGIPDDAVPETPPRSFGRELQNDITETPRKSDASPEYKLITPLGSGCKIIPLPRLHKRKSLCMLEEIEGSSPGRKENLLKKRAHEDLGYIGTKLLKTEENSTIPKARAALFQDEQNESKLTHFTLSTKTFYSSCEKKENFNHMRTIKNTMETERRRSLPNQLSFSRRSLKKRKMNGINSGVSHGIKKPKPKKHIEDSNENMSNNSKRTTPDNAQSPATPKSSSLKENRRKENNTSIIVAPRVPSPEIDPNKRFFKTNRTIKQNHVATVTVNDKIKLKVANGKIALKEDAHSLSRHTCKRMKLDISFDTTDLTVDEPEVEASIEQSKVDNILKVLEDDWADDDYDTMEILTNQKPNDVTSPAKSNNILLNDTTMSPASELSNMTSTMNIEDAAAPVTFENITFNNSTNNNDVENKKYYALFAKGYSSNKAFQECRTPKSSRGKGNIKWQLSAKGAEEDQYQIDAGQKRFGATQCTECGVVYQMGDPEDENAHLNYHNSIKILKFPGWKNERVIVEDIFTGSRIILIEPNDSKQSWNKVSSILQVVDRDLGLADADVNEYLDKKVYLYIRDKSVLGVLVAERIESAHRMIPELIELDCCTAESTPAKCGINVVWTAMSHRKQGIATKLVDTLRAQFFYGYIMTLDDIAFSIPTPSGKMFAEKYTKTRNFKVYN